MPQNRFGVLGHDLRARHDAVDGHGADHQRHDGVRRDAEREQRDEGGLRAGVVGALRSRDALDGALAEAASDPSRASSRSCRTRRARARRRCRAGCRGCRRWPCRAGSARPSPCMSCRLGSSRPIACLDDVARLGVVEVAQDLGDAEEAHGERRRSRCRRTGTAPEGHALLAGLEVGADRREQDADEDHGDGLAGSSRAPARPRRRGPSPSARSIRPARRSARAWSAARPAPR